MKKVLAELHELINDLEDQGLTAEASSLQEVFVRVAQEADTEDDLANDVESILKSHSAAEIVAEIAKQMAGAEKDTHTSSFAFGDEPGGYGNEPKNRIIDEFVTQVKRKENTPHDAYKMMNDRLGFNGHDTMGYNEFLKRIQPDNQTSSFAFGDEPGGYGNESKEKIIDEFVTQVKRKENTPHDAYKMMNDRLQFNGHGTMGYNEFLDKVSPSVAKVSEFAFGDEPDSGAEAPGVDEETERQNIISSWKKHVEKGNMSRGSAARMATQQLRMKFPNAKLITETEIVPLRFPDNGKPFGDEPGVAEQDGLKPTNSNHPIVKEYVDKASRYKMDKEEAYAEMNEKLKAIGQRPYVRSSFNIDVYNHTHMIKTIGYQGPGGPFDPRPVLDRYLDETGKEMSERHKKFPYSSPTHQSSR